MVNGGVPTEQARHHVLFASGKVELSSPISPQKQSALLFTLSWREKRYIHVFPGALSQREKQTALFKLKLAIPFLMMMTITLSLLNLVAQG